VGTVGASLLAKKTRQRAVDFFARKRAPTS
jgi:hypothetical protein